MSGRKGALFLDYLGEDGLRPNRFESVWIRRTLTNVDDFMPGYWGVGLGLRNRDCYWTSAPDASGQRFSAFIWESWAQAKSFGGLPIYGLQGLCPEVLDDVVRRLG